MPENVCVCFPTQGDKLVLINIWSKEGNYLENFLFELEERGAFTSQAATEFVLGG